MVLSTTAFAVSALMVLADDSCPGETGTLYYLDGNDPKLQMIAANNADDCCTACSSAPSGTCATWSFTMKWTPNTPCHLSATAPLRTVAESGSSGGSWAPQQCAGETDTLYYLDGTDRNLQMIATKDAHECCKVCSSVPSGTCATWSFTMEWTPDTPCHLSAIAPLRKEAASGSSGGTWAPPAPPPASGMFTIDALHERQTIEGIGFEIQSDSVGSGTNPDMPTKVSGVPHDLLPDERARFYSDMLLGFRRCRLALGLYLRGLDEEQQHIIQRWDTQMEELAELQRESSIEGFDVEYWSPAPYWKGPNQTYVCDQGGRHPRSMNESFIDAFATAMAADATYLTDHGLRIKWWGLQNEPYQCVNYASMQYDADTYHTVFKAVAPKIKKAVPGVLIEAGSGHGCQKEIAKVFSDPETAKYVDAWTYHRGGQDSASEMTNRSCGDGKPVWNNEWEFFHFNLGAHNTIDMAQNLMNWFVFSESPMWTWLHALKPSYNSESVGFGLGFWRPYDDEKTQAYEKGHWVYNNITWNALAGFVRYMPWDAVRVAVAEDVYRKDQRILAFKTPSLGSGGPHHQETPEGLLGIVLTNRDASKSFTANITLQGASASAFRGHRYNASAVDVELGQKSADKSTFAVTLPPLSIEFWVQYHVGSKIQGVGPDNTEFV